MEAHEFVRETLLRAGDHLREALQKGIAVDHKGDDPRDIITNVDTEINDLIISAIRSHFPEDRIYSEESAPQSNASARRVWTIDPIDGSSNFARGIPHYAIVIGLLIDEVPVAGGVYNPITNELFSFEKGVGAFLNGVRIHVSDITELNKAGIFLHAGRKPELWGWGGHAYTALLERAQKTSNFAGSALDLCFLAAGRVEGVVYGRLSMRDIAPAIGILLEAGGMIRGEQGQALVYEAAPQKIFASNNQEINEALRAAISPQAA